MPSTPSLVFSAGDKPIIDRDYKLIAELGAGGFGQVWRASGEGLGQVALKVVNLAGLKEAKRELWALQRINKVQHANLVTVSAAYVIDRTRHRLDPDDWDSEDAAALVIVMRLCEKSLDKLLREHRAAGAQGIPLDELLHYMEGAARGLDYLHKPNPEQGRDQAIVHCDIKPLNILIAGGEPLICDFGLARVFDTGDTKYTTQLGSIAYMPPEVLLEGKAATPPSDQYSLAISYIELRTGLLPFGTGEQVTLGDVNRALINQSHNLTRLEAGERGVIERAILREPRNRFPTCLEMVEALWAATAEEPQQKPRGLFDKLFGRSGEAAPSGGLSGRTPRRSGPHRPEPRPGRTMLAPQSPGPGRDRSTPVTPGDDSARQSTAPPEFGSLDTAPVMQDADHDSRSARMPAGELEAGPVSIGGWGTPGAARPREKSGRRVPIFKIGVGILLLGAVLVGADVLPGRNQVVHFAKVIYGFIVTPPPPPIPPIGGQFLREMSAILEKEDFANFIAKLNSPPGDVTFGTVASLKKQAGTKWRDVLQRRFDEGEFNKAVPLLDPAISEVIDPNYVTARGMWLAAFDKRLKDRNSAQAAQLFDAKLSAISDQDGAGSMWAEEFDKLVREEDFAEAVQLLAPGFVDHIKDAERKREEARAAWLAKFQRHLDGGEFDEAAALLDAKLSEIADPPAARGMWVAVLEKRLQEEDFARAAPLLAPGIADRIEDSEAMREKARAAWSGVFKQRLEKGKITQAAELLDAGLSEIADLEAARGLWEGEIEKRLQEKNLAEAAQLLVPAFTGSFDPDEAMRKKARAAWLADFQPLFAEGKTGEAAGLLVPELSPVIDRQAGGELWKSAFDGLLNKPDREEADLKKAEQLLEACDPGLLGLSRVDFKNQIDRARGNSMGIRMAWPKEMRALLEAGDFAGFVDKLKSHPKEVQEADAEAIGKEGIKAWSAELERRLAGGDFVKAAELLDDKLSAIADLKAAQEAWAGQLGKRFQQRKFTEAAELLGDRFSAIGNPEAAQAAYMQTFRELLAGPVDEAERLILECNPMLVKARAEELKRQLELAKNDKNKMILSAWLTDVEEAWTANPIAPDTAGILKKCDDLLKTQPNCAQAQLIRTRVRLEDQQIKQEDITKFEAIDSSVLPGDLKHLQKLLATFVLGESSDADWEKISENLVDLGANPPADAGAGFLQLTKVENARLDTLRAGTVKFLLARIQGRVDSGEFATARKDLQAAEGLAPDKNQLADLQYWQALVDLRDPESDRGQLAEALGSAEQFMASGRAKAGSAEEIAKAMVALGAEASPRVDLALLTKALVPLRAACDQFKYGDVPKRFGELLVQATRLRIAEAEPATPEELTQLEDDLRHTAGAEVQSAVAKAWMAESRIRQGQGVEDAEELLRNIEAQIPADDPYAAYGAYVRALVYNSLDPPRWDDALEALDGAVGSPLVDQQGRMATAAGMVLKAMARQKEWADKKAIDRYLVESPFLSPDEAERYFRLLSKVEKTVVAGGDAAEAEKAQAMQARTLEVGLMLAALFRPEPALEPAWSCASRLAQLSDAELASDALPVLASCVRTHLRRLEPGAVTADDQKIAIVACTRIARLLEDDKVAPDDASVANVYDPILKPIAGIVDLYAEGIAQGKPQAVDPAVLEDFYGALGKLIWTRQSVRWPFASTPEDVAKETARLLDGAISLHDLRPDADEVEKVAEYHLKCGHAELAMLERDLDSAQAHADQVLKLTPGNNGANGLLSGIFLWRSREQLTRVDRLENLVRSIEWGEQAVQNAPPDEPLLVTWLIGLGTAYVERANFTRDVSFQTQKDDLNRAIDYGEQAAKLENANPDYPYLIQGNAYEDLAWLVRDDVEANVVDNYEKAIEKFWAAADTNTYRRAQALCCLGRCYYKIVADSNLDPSTWRVRDLDRLSAEETLKKAAQHLQDAILEDPAMADAFYFLGLVQRQLGDPAEADKNFEIAKNIAIQKKLSAADVYAQQWVAMGAAFADPRETAPDLVKKRVESLAGEAGPMGEALRASAQVALVQSLLQRAKDSQEPLGDCDEVLRLVDAALGKDLSDANSEHVALILARTECRVRKGLIEGRTKVWNWDDAKATLTDADWAVKLAYTRGFLSDSFLFRAMIRGLIGSHILNSPDQATNGPPPPWQEPGADISQIDQGIDDLREAIRLEPGLEARRAADLRSQGIALVFHKKKKEKSLLAQGRQLTPDERERYLADLENAIRWAEEWLQIPSIKPDERTSCEQLRRQFEDERNSVSNPSPK